MVMQQLLALLIANLNTSSESISVPHTKPRLKLGHSKIVFIGNDPVDGLQWAYVQGSQLFPWP